LVRNVVIRNVTLAKAPLKDSILNGYSDTRGIDGLLIENLEIEGKKITTAEQARMHADHVQGLKFLPGTP
jgi:hypothetical protein